MRFLGTLALVSLLAACAARRAPTPVPPQEPSAGESVSTTPPLPSKQPEDQGPRVILAAVGDVTLAGRFQEWFDERVEKKEMSRDQMMRYAFDRVREALASADIAFANCESTFTTRGKAFKKPFTFRARPELAGILADGGFDVVSLANNHTWDYGDEGILDTVSTITSLGLKQVGAGKDGVETRTPALFEVNGIRIGFLAYSAVGTYDVSQPATGKVYDTSAPGIAACVGDWLCLHDMVISDTRALAAQVDVVVLSFHWGVERSNTPEEFQRVLAHDAVDAGAKVILGHHPHVLQGIERYKGALIAYSLGNFVFGGNWNPQDTDSMILKIALSRKGATAAKILPVKISNPPNAYFQPYLLEGAERESVLARLREYSAGFEHTLPALRIKAASTQ